MLKGQARKDFEKWLNENKELRDFLNLKCGLTTQNFNVLPFSMQYGVIVDWFDSVDIDVDKNTVYFSEGWDKPRARQKAIEQVNKIYNERYESK